MINNIFKIVAKLEHMQMLNTVKLTPLLNQRHVDKGGNHSYWTGSDKILTMVCTELQTMSSILALQTNKS